LGTFLYDNENDKAGAELFPKAIETMEGLAAEFPSMPGYRFDLAKCRRDYAKVLGYLKKSADAAEQFRKAIILEETLVADNPTVLPYQADLGLSYAYFADLISEGDAPADSLPWYGKAIHTLTTTYEQDRQVILTKTALSKCYEHRGNIYDSLGRYADALPDRDKALEFCPLDMCDIYRFQRVDSRLRSGLVAEAIAEVAELAKIEIKRPGHWVSFASLYAIASVKIESRKVEYADRAVELLRKAVALGYKDTDRLAKDTDLDCLRDRDDFKKLLADLKEK
jgi:eukaryotic-like serine/threonine-protein kinase